MDTFAQVIAAFAGVGALIAAVWAGRTAKKLYDIETGRDAQREQERQQSDARNVTAWVAVLRPDQDRRNGLTLHNGASTPIYEVTIESTGSDGNPEPDLRLNVVPPGRYFIARTYTANYHWEFADEVTALDGYVRPIMKKPEWAVRSLRFKDAAGRLWQRDGSGSLLPQTHS